MMRIVHLQGINHPENFCNAPAGSNFATITKEFCDIRDNYNPETNPFRKKEFAEVVAAFEFLQRQFTSLNFFVFPEPVFFLKNLSLCSAANTSPDLFHKSRRG